MNYIAVYSDGKVLDVATTQDSSLESMQAFSQLGYKNLGRCLANEKAFFDYSNGEVMHVHPIIESGKLVGHEFVSI